MVGGGGLVVVGGAERDPAVETFADEFVNGEVHGDAALAARAAGLGTIDNPRAARLVAARAGHQEAIRRAVVDRLMGASAVLVIRTLETVCADAGAAPSDRVKAAAALGRLITDVAAARPADVASPNNGQAAIGDADKIKEVARALADALKNDTGG